VTAINPHCDNYQLTLRQQSINVGTADKPLPQTKRMHPVLFLLPDTGTFEENAEDILTIFLDCILTKYFRKRGVNGC
jgi:hypothetical protein